MLWNVVSSSSLTYFKLELKHPEKLNDKITENQSNGDTEEDDVKESFKEETESAMYKLGGGCLHEILQRTRLTSVNTKFCFKKRSNDETLYKVGLIIRMNDIEKENLPLDLKIRYNGKLSFPKSSFLAFIRILNDKVREHASKAALEKNGTQMIKKCAKECFGFMQKDEQVMQFQEALPDSFDWVELDCMKFYQEWCRKMIHARIQEFVSSWRKKRKGGQTLRDKLYGFKEKSEKKKKEKKLRNPISQMAVKKEAVFSRCQAKAESRKVPSQEVDKQSKACDILESPKARERKAKADSRKVPSEEVYKQSKACDILESPKAKPRSCDKKTKLLPPRNKKKKLDTDFSYE